MKLAPGRNLAPPLTRPHRSRTSTTAIVVLATAALAAAACSASTGTADDGGPGPAQHLVAVSASRQTGVPDADVSAGPVVKVTDASGRPLADVPVVFSVTAGGGTVTPATAVSGPDGQVSASWRLGAPGAQELRATSDQIPGAVATFSAQAVSTAGYHIDLQLLTSATDTQWAAFTAAADRISQVIVGGAAPSDLTGRSCDGTTLSGSAQLLILVRLTAIDGRGGILGQAGPCVVRGSGPDAGLPAAGIMEFDTADLASLESSGKLRSTILHEMLHVVGFGTLWDDGMLSGAGTASSGFLGPQALTAAVGYNGAPPSWATVPVENCVGRTSSQCGAGTRDAHWLETTFQSELMTGWLSGTTQPLSRTTVASMADLGYAVNLDAADPFTLPGAAALLSPEAVPEPGERLADDVLHLPIEFVP